METEKERLQNEKMIRETFVRYVDSIRLSSKAARDTLADQLSCMLSPGNFHTLSVQLAVYSISEPDIKSNEEPSLWVPRSLSESRVPPGGGVLSPISINDPCSPTYEPTASSNLGGQAAGRELRYSPQYQENLQVEMPLLITDAIWSSCRQVIRCLY